MKTVIISSLGCGHFSRVEFIQGWKLFAEILYWLLIHCHLVFLTFDTLPFGLLDFWLIDFKYIDKRYTWILTGKPRICYLLLHWRQMYSSKPNQPTVQLCKQYWSTSHHRFCSLFGFFQQNHSLNDWPPVF